MTLAQLANFIRIAELQSLSKAAAVISIAQPALSRQVRQLEGEFGVPLLVRHPWGVTLTLAGEALLASARRLVREAEGVRDAVRAIESHPRGRITVGIPSSLSPTLLPPLAATLRERYPDVQPHFVEGFSATINHAILAGDVDMAVLYADRYFDALPVAPLLRERLVIVGPADAELVEPVAIGSIPLHRMILPARPNRLRLIVDDALARLNGRTTARMEVDSVLAAISMIECGFWMTILPSSTVAQSVAAGKVKAWSIEDPAMARTLVLARAPGRPATPASQAMEREIRAAVAGLAGALGWHPLAAATGARPIQPGHGSPTQ